MCEVDAGRVLDVDAREAPLDLVDELGRRSDARAGWRDGELQRRIVRGVAAGLRRLRRPRDPTVLLVGVAFGSAVSVRTVCVPEAGFGRTSP